MEHTCADALEQWPATARHLWLSRKSSVCVCVCVCVCVWMDASARVRARVSEGYLEALVFLAELADLLPQLLDQLLLRGTTPQAAAARPD